MKKNISAAAPLGPAVDHAQLLAMVRGGDVAYVRATLDDTLRGSDVARPTWEHLQFATEARNIAMMRLLITWGAIPSRDELAGFQLLRGERATTDLQNLRLAGLKTIELGRVLPPVKAQPLPVSRPLPTPVSEINYQADLIPADWKTLLRSFQQNGAPEAIIGGGALRDIFNGRAVSDVDIFLKTPMIGSREKILQKAFRDAGIKTHGHIVYDDYGMMVVDFKRCKKIENSYDRENSNMGRIEAWKVTAGKEKTEYNIVFVNSTLASDMRKDAKKPGKLKYAPLKEFMQRFDIGLCQIAFNGQDILTTAAYDRDVQNRTVTLCQSKHSSLDHIKRVMAKYSDWRPCETISTALKTGVLPPPPERPYSAMENYAYVAPRLYM